MINTTEIAAKKIKTLLEGRGKGLGIRIGTKTAGCSGYSYVMEYVDVESDDMISTTTNDVVVFMKKTDAPLIEDVTIDYVKQGLNEGFEFINPAEVGKCGCGESFNV
jgi:iron-sulfur cluster assembly protein